jgi:hypothetical protein
VLAQEACLRGRVIADFDSPEETPSGEGLLAGYRLHRHRFTLVQIGDQGGVREDTGLGTAVQIGPSGHPKSANPIHHGGLEASGLQSDTGASANPS